MSKKTSQESPHKKDVSMNSTKSLKMIRSNKEAAKKGDECIRHVLDSGVKRTVQDLWNLAIWKPEGVTTEAYEGEGQIQGHLLSGRKISHPQILWSLIRLLSTGSKRISSQIHANYVALRRTRRQSHRSYSSKHIAHRRPLQCWVSLSLLPITRSHLELDAQALSCPSPTCSRGCRVESAVWR